MTRLPAYRSLIPRYLEDQIREDLSSKMVFISGPRQVGKTTLARMLAPKNSRYLNWDVEEDRQRILHQEIPQESFLIFDEVHKFNRWRNYLKGMFDAHREHKQILVTGSARLDYYRYSGDSLQGRYHLHRLHPLSVAELGLTTDKDFDALLRLGGFPEPFFSGSQRQAQRWRRDYQQRYVYEEVTALEQSQQLTHMQLLMERLPRLVGSPLSINGLREDLQLAHATVAKWLDIFERMYMIFRLLPFGSDRIKTVKKEQKHYHYDWGVVDDEAARLENLVACHLLKWVHAMQDGEGEDYDLTYFRDRTGREVDFVVTLNKRPKLAIEVKSAERDISKHLVYFKRKFPEVQAIQVHRHSAREYRNKDNVHVKSWGTFLSNLV